jgi:membrane-associated phospholipid phosphatase
LPWRADETSRDCGRPRGRQNVVINLTITLLIVVAVLLLAGSLFTQRRVAVTLCVAGLLTALTGLMIGVHTHGWVTGLDSGVASWFSTHRSRGFDVAASVVTALGSPAVTGASGLICGALLSWRARSVIPAVVVIGTVGAAALASAALKPIVERPQTAAELQLLGLIRTDDLFSTGHVIDNVALLINAPRPHPWTPGELHLITLVLGDHSFPSGHVAGTGALLGIIAVCVGIRRSRTARAWLAGSVVAGLMVVAVTRLYLCAHWLTDDIGGAILAGVFVTLGAAVTGALRARSGREAPQQSHGVSP